MYAIENENRISYKIAQADFSVFLGAMYWELVKTTILEQDPPNHKMVGGVCLHPPCFTSKDGVFVA